MTKILIYGGTGIISREVVRYAVSCGYDVTMINRGRRDFFYSDEGIIRIKADLANDDISKIASQLCGYYDCVIDFYSRKTNDLIKCMQIVKEKCNQYIFISSAVIYKNDMCVGGNRRISENNDIQNIEWNYANDKIECEKILVDKSSSFGIHYTIVRPYVTYDHRRIPLQYTPMEYYTIIHRMRHHKVIPVFGDEVKCTLTSSSDFAIGLIGLVNNQMAYNECFHITGEFETNWNHVLSIVANAFHVNCETINVPIELVESLNSGVINTMGLDQILGDKGKNMVFDNSKIKRAVPLFRGNDKLESQLKCIVDYYSENVHRRIVNQYWDGKVDEFLILTKLINKSQKKRLRYYPSEEKKYFERVYYCVGRYKIKIVI